MLDLVKEEHDATTGLLGDLAERDNQVGEILDDLARVGHAFGSLDVEPGVRAPFEETVMVKDFRTPAARRARSFQRALGASCRRARRVG